MVLSDLTGDTNRLASGYSRFNVQHRLLLTGHSHQAWPDVGFEAQQQAWLDAAELLDLKWDAALEKAGHVQRHWKRLLNDSAGAIALGQNTHELVTRLLSALPLRLRPRLVTTDGEFYTIRRQLDRLAEEGLEVVKVPAGPADTLAERLALAVNDKTSCVLVSSVLYATAEVVPELDRVALACARHGAELLIDAYHHINALPFHSGSFQHTFVTGGGYKYCQLGEGNCFLRIPPECRLRPVLTGWFAEFSSLEDPARGGRVAYAPGATRFAGATYDPTSHYRAASVLDFHVREGLTPEFLREVSRYQVSLLKSSLEAMDPDPSIARVEPMPDERRGGFLAIRSPHARELCEALRKRQVLTDFRDDVLRFGPAPYLTDAQLRDAMKALEEALLTRRKT
jgi:kynureninase